MKSKIRDLLQRLPTTLTRSPKAVLFVTAFAALGVILLLTSRAATPYASLEPEQGVVATGACLVSDNAAAGSGAVQFGGCSATGLRAATRDKAIQLDWEAVAGATAYKIERQDVSNYIKPLEVIANVTGTSYLDSPATFSNPGGKGLVNGQTYTYKLIPVINGSDAAPVGPITGMPDDGYSLAGWTELRGAKKRDARNTGHWGAGKTNASLRVLEPNNCYSATACTYVMSPNETLDGVLANITVEVRGGQVYTVKNSWLRRGIANHATNGNPQNLLVEDTTLGPGPGEADSSYNYNGIIGSGVNGNYTCRRCRTMWVGSVFFAPSGNVTIEDTFVHDTYGYEPPGGDAHMDVVWVQNSSGSLTVRRNNLECSNNCSAILGPGPIVSGTYIVEDNLLNGGGAQGIVVNSLYQVRRNRWKRSPSGFYPNGAGFCPVDTSYGPPGVFEDNLWADNNQPVQGSVSNCY